MNKTDKQPSNLIKFYTEKELRELYNLTNYHRGSINNKRCGCFHCLKTFDAEFIKEWVDAGQTAICPFCEVDSVLYQVEGITLSHNLLYQMYNRWFGKTYDNFPFEKLS